MEVNPLVQLIPFLFFSLWIGLLARLLARDKGRNVNKWETILGLVPSSTCSVFRSLSARPICASSADLTNFLELQRRQ